MTPEQELELQAMKETLIACYNALGPWVRYCQERFPGIDPVEKAKEHMLKVLTSIIEASGDPGSENATMGDPVYCYNQYRICQATVPRPPDCYARYLQCIGSTMPEA